MQAKNLHPVTAPQEAETTPATADSFPALRTRIILVVSLLILLILVIWPLGQETSQSTPASSPHPVASPSPLPNYSTKSGKSPQFVLLSFDGSQSQDMWEATRSFARSMNQQGKPLHFTYFISGVYFLTPQTAHLYSPPGHPVGTSAIGFADSTADIAMRVHEINAAVAEGNEIGSHANGHFDGSNWSEDQWKQEMTQFHNLVFNWQENNQIGQSPTSSGTPPLTEKLQLLPTEMRSFRAPLLGRNESMYQVLHDQGFLYDSSGVAASPSAWPTKDTSGLWSIPMSSIPLSGTRGEVLSMDYNFFVTQSRGLNLARRGSPLWQRYYQQMYQSYLNHFNSNYNGNRAPVVIGHHFSTWNDGVYWQVMQDFASTVCGKPEVHCVTFSELGQYLDHNPHP